ncbi:non-ribosomal peptide synthase/polyketide synthase [Pseudomonas sp. LRF_L74]|uniref:non-ribosomal peptide synthase/polyketide synthase n=1 Tax=Pseudomonas sp. LRF_L74 TaxID=3369422 RepID=UPI003F5F29DF
MKKTFERPVSVARALMVHAAQQGERPALRFLSAEHHEGEVFSYAQLDAKSRSIAATLSSRAQIGDRALLLFPSGPDYVASFFACQYAGVIAVPAYPPESTQPQHLKRLVSIIEDAEPALILTVDALVAPLKMMAKALGKALPEVLAVDTLDDSAGHGWQAPELPPSAIAFLQYTSGSTAMPKGVQVSHGNLEANEWLIRQGYRVDDGDVIVSWLPLYHDMGLIGGLLQGIYSGVPVVLMSPQYFLERPVRWLEAVGRFKGTISGGPDFAYRLCCERIADSKLAELDLSGWRVAFSGAEPIRQDSLEAFAERFAPCGFKRSFYLASYGLAEGTLFVTGGRPGEGIPALQVDGEALAANQAKPGDGPVLMSCGWEQPEHPVQIVEPNSFDVLEDGQVGEIWSSGPSVAHGYWRNPEATAKTFIERDGRTWLRTGDLGFRHMGEIFVTGRLKDMLIIRGQNLYPQDVERTVEDHVEVVRKGRVAAFSVQRDGQESLGIAAEISRKSARQVPPEDLAQQIRLAVSEAHRESPSVVVLLNPGALPKTSSGKLQRSACRAQLEAGTLDSIAIFRDGETQAQVSAEPVGSLAERVSAVWRDSLKVERLADDANFFAQGGNSIQAIQMIAELRDQLQVDLQLSDLYQAPVLSAFIAYLEGLARGDAPVRIGRQPEDAQLPLSAGQRRLWLLAQKEPNSAAYNIPGGLSLRGELDAQALQTVFVELLERHTALRTVFVEQGDEVLQRIVPADGWTLIHDDLSSLPSPQRDERAAQIRDDEARHAFDLQSGPLLRVRLVSLDEQDHLLLVTLHHIVADGWSLSILLDEFAKLYAAQVQGLSASLPALPIRYADFAAWQHEQAPDDAQLNYWTQQLTGDHDVLNLPLDHARGSGNSPAARLQVKMDKTLAERVRAFARQQETTTFVVLLAAFQALLHRYSGQVDIRLGVPSAGRYLPQTQGLVGFFINTQVLRIGIAPRQSFAGLLRAAREVVSAAQANQQVDFSAVAEAIGDNQPFEVMFNHQQRDLSALRRLPGLLAEELPWNSREAKFDLQLQSEEDARGQISLAFDYAEALFEARTVERLAEHFVQLLKHACDEPERALFDLPLLAGQEQDQLLRWSRNVVAQPKTLLPELLAEQAKSSPDALALTSSAGELTYTQLHDRAEKLARHLLARGIGPEARVGLMAHRSEALMVALLAVIRTGAAYVPLDPDYPQDRLRYMIEDSGIALLLADAELLERIELPAALPRLSLEALPILGETPAGVMPRVEADNLAYVIYTSGSTGKPKGVGVSHGALAERLHWMREEYALNERDVFLQKAPLSFDVSVWECFLPLIIGSRLVVSSPGDQRDPARLVQWVREQGVSVLHFVPPLLQLFIEEPALRESGSLRLLFSGGEALSVELARRVREVLPNTALHNRYGPTEAAINACHWPVQGDERERMPIGIPLANSICTVLDEEGQLLPSGVAGELYLGGAGLARGYLGRPALTAERFVPSDEGARLYRSGDRARVRHDGALEYLGRLDEQVKLRGVRIELEEIRNLLLQQAAVRQAAVVLRDSATGAQLVAYLCAEGDEAELVMVERLKAALAESLPDYMVPAQFVFLASLPLTPSGKLDSKALPEPAWKTRAYVAPQTPVEIQTAAIWSEVLGIERIGLDDDFFALGGHSLLATRIVSRARQAFDIELPLRSLFEASQLSAFVAWIEGVRSEGLHDSQGAIARIDRGQRVPLSHSQQRMWFLWQMEPDSPAYNVGGMARLRGELDAARFEQALQDLILRHETLRTTFPSEAGKAWQRVAETSDVQMLHMDYSDSDATRVKQRLQALADEQAHQPFDLERGPLLRVCLVRTAEQEHFLVVTLHHIVTEGWAMDVFAREWGELYEARLAGIDSPLAPLPVQYLDYSAWQRQWLEAGEGERQLQYWKAKLGDEHPLLELPSDRPRPAVQSSRGELFRFDLDDDLAARVREYNSANGLTLFMTMVATLALLLYRYSGQPDLRIGAPVANRTRPESEGLIGAFLNTQVLRCQLDGQMSVAELLSQVRATVIEGQSHQDLPFDHLVEALQPPRSAAYNPLFQVMCNVQRWEFQQSRQLAGVTLDYLVNDARATKFDLYLEVTDLDQRLGCCFTYSRDLFDEPRIARMAEHWRNLLAAMVEAPQRRLADLPMFSSGEALLGFTGEPDSIGLDQCLHELFSQQAARTPQAPALTFAGQTLSYAALEARANQLAHRLQEKGVGPEVRVGLAFERSLEMVIGLLAILKAGGAYVPLDPEYPAERLQYMIEDSGIVLLLGEQTLFETLGELPDTVEAWSFAGDSGLDALPTRAPATAVTAGNLAYIIYTSGSTGRPKGVAVAHGEIAMHCAAVIKRFGLGPDDCELHFYSINFDAATERLLTPLLCGARVVIREQGQWGAEDICQLIREQRVNILGFTPSYGSQLAQWLAGRGERLPVRLCITGGEALTPEHLQRIREGFAPERFFNAYGPTETVVMPLTCLAPAQLSEGALSVPIGTLVGDRAAYLLDDDLALLPQGAAGELYIGGAGLARGYHQRAALTAERFVPDPFSAEGGRLYRSGDRVTQNADGLAEYIGRIDQQVKVRGFRIELGEIEARLLEHPAVDEAAVLALDTPSGKQLIGYVASQVRADELRDGLKAFLRSQLPDYMVPTHLLFLDHLPLMPNGKLDRRALPAPDLNAAAQQYAAPQDDTQAQLARAWQDVLGIERIGVDDNFFELGGDSILSIQVVSRARQFGLHFSPRDLFQHQTIRDLAQIASHEQLHQAEQGLISGDSALTPIQHWFFEQPMPQRSHWNQALLFEPAEALDAQRLVQALQRVLEQHDALRLRFQQQGETWKAEYVLPDGEALLRCEQVADLKDCEALFNEVQQSLDLAQGPLLRALLVSNDRDEQRLLLVIHHLAVDGVSWRVLLDDLQNLYRQPDAVLPAKTSAFRDWTARLAAYASSESLREELNWWQVHLHDASDALPCERPDGANHEALARQVSVRLDDGHTRQLLQQAPAAYRTRVDDLLLSALARVVCRWSGGEKALIQLEGHGREELFEELDLTRTVGWFTSTYPLCLRPEASAGDTIKAIKEQLRAVPHKGLGYGVLRYLADAGSRSVVASLPQAPITFNYLGQVEQGFADALLRPLEGGVGAVHDAQAPLPNQLSVDAQVLHGQLVMRWTFSEARYDAATIQRLAEALRDELLVLIGHCLEEGAGGPTPSDFPLARLDQAQLDALPVPAAQIEDVYPLTPMQEGLLLHTLLEPGTGIYYMQDRYRINAELDLERFAEAWRQVIARHEALRASFSWSEGEAMLQIIHKAGGTQLDILDWRDLPEAKHEEILQALHKREREAGFDLLREPPFHLRLIRVGEARYWFMMSNHHILIDAWCRGLLMSDFFECYAALGEGHEAKLAAAPRYRDYIAWLGRQDQAASRNWWRATLSGFERPTPLPSDRPILREQGGAVPVEDRYTRLAVEEGARLRELVQRHQLTINTFAQAAWALVLRRYSGDRDVLFGVTVAGRPVDMPSMQRTVGLFINSIPLRVRLPGIGERLSVRDWLRGLLDRNMELREHEYLPLVTIQECSELPKGQPLFDSLFVFENAPVEAEVHAHARSLNASSDSGRTHTNFPLTVVCYPGDDLGLHLSFDPRYFSAQTVETLLGEFKRLLLALADGLMGDVSELPLIAKAEQRDLIETCNRSDASYPLDAGYARLFEARVAAHPQRLVARCEDESWRYDELNQQANRLGHALIEAGLGFDQPVALLADRSLELLGMIVGSFKAGAGYLPLDPGHPSQRLLRILQLSRAPVLVCTEASREQAKDVLGELPEAQRPRLLVWEDVQGAAYGTDNPGRYSAPDNLAYVIYTSGSTGLPKGVMVEQAGMLNNQLAKVPYLQLSEQDVIAQTASQSFDISVWQFLAAPLFGGRVEIIPNAVAHDPKGLLQRVRERGVTVLESVPSLIQGMLAEESVVTGSLRWMLPTGEAMPPELARQWLARHPSVALVNAYGPAECSDDVAFFQVDEASTEGSYLPIGTPTDNNRLFILDETLDLVPARASGELCIAGTGVGRGYVGDPLRTALTFVPHPFGAAGERLYRSGDLARRRDDGVLEYVGRLDHQVKIRGFRIELGEIESRLHEHGEVRDVAVAVQEGANGSYLVGYLVPAVSFAKASDPAAEVVQRSELFERLKQYLRTSLPDYMVPLHWCLLERMPLNANGKLDRKALPALEIGQLQAQAFVAPRNDLERTLAGIWADVLKVEKVGIHDNFFDLGGHSLLATQIASRVQKALQRNVPLRAMFECHSVEALAGYIDALEGAALTEQKASRLDDLMSRLEAL